MLIGSVTGFAPVLGRPPYVAAKHAVTGLFTAIRPELEQQGIGVTIVHLTFVTGGMSEAARGGERTTSGPEVTPQDVADALLDGSRTGVIWCWWAGRPSSPGRSTGWLRALH